MPSSVQANYDALLAKYKDLVLLRSAEDVVIWDMETKMPARGLELRSEQMALLSVLAHRMLTDKAIGKRLDAIEKGAGNGELTAEQGRNVHLLRKGYDEATSIPDKLVAEMSKQQTLSVGHWKKAKAAKDFSMFQDHLRRNIELKEKVADILMEVKGTRTPYDALLDIYEPGMTADRITKVFGGMRNGLMKILRRVDGEDQPDHSFLTRPMSIDAQRKISAMLMEFIGYRTSGPDAWGRLDETEHPFSNGYFTDVRITTHYHEDNYKSSIFSVLHEGGHALYEGNIPSQWMYQPIGSAASYGIHESQSRFVENMVGRSPEFWEYMLPRIRKIAPKALSGVELEDFVRAVNAAERSKIRIEADELTYGLHIIIRFELERDIFADKLTVEELPRAWNEKYSKYIGVEVNDDSEGIMQDTHWAGASFGYFPSYALGNIYGGMFLQRMDADLPDWRSSLSAGDYRPVGGWLTDNVHSKGDMYDPADLVKVVTGRSLNIQPFLSYLERKMNMIYDG